MKAPISVDGQKRKKGVSVVGIATCEVSFKVTCGTVFHGAKIALQKWFLAISLSNAKKSLSSSTGARFRLESEDSRIRRKWQKNIIEADETYIGGKPRKKNKRSDDEPAKRGRGTDKDAIIGAVQRGGKVVAQLHLDSSLNLQCG